MMTQEQLLERIGRGADTPGDDIHAWLNAQKADLIWLLAHTYGGVVWGKRDEAGWALSSDLPDQPPLTTSTLLELRVFGSPGEVFVWRDGAGLRARALFDDGVDDLDMVVEEQVLWGSMGERVKGSPFTRVTDGSQGMEMMVPLAPTAEDFRRPLTDEDGKPVRDKDGKMQMVDWRPLRLAVRNYVVQHSKTGLAQIAASRLEDLFVKPYGQMEARDVAEAQ